MTLRQTTTLLCAGLAALSGAALPTQNGAKIGIYDLAAIHATPLNPEVLSKKTENGIVTEAVRITTVPGVRALVWMSYKTGARGAPGVLFATRFAPDDQRLAAQKNDAKVGFVGISVSPPVGNDDEKRLDSVGGPAFTTQATSRQLFNRDPNLSPLYHGIVALTRAIDYLASRPELNVGKLSVMGQDWSGMSVAVLHGIDNRPGSYFIWHGCGYYSDEDGNSGDGPSRMTREQYEMYAPAAYAPFGTRPIFMANALNGDISRFDAQMEMVKNLKSPKVAAFAPNREDIDTADREFAGTGAWQTYWNTPFGEPPSISEGKVTNVNGHVRYYCTANGLTSAYILVSYGEPGNWTGRNWHRIPLRSSGAGLAAEVPIYDPKVPFYVIGQIHSKQFGERGNTPVYVNPADLKITEATAQYPHTLFSGVASDEINVGTYDFYKNNGVGIQFGLPGPEGGKSAIIPSFWDGNVRIKNIEPRFWKGATYLDIWIKGDGKKNTESFNIYLAYDSHRQLDFDQQNFTTKTVWAAGVVRPAQWTKVTIPIKEIGNLQRVDSIFFHTGLRGLVPLELGSISWR